MRQKNKLVIGVDAGGTKVRGILLSGDKLLKKAEAFHQAKKVTQKVFLQSLFTVVDSLMVAGVDGVGIGVPGIVKDNRVIEAGVVKDLIGLDLVGAIKQRYGLRAVVDHDVNVALRAESRYFKKTQRVFMVTLGTDVGGAYWRDSQLDYGSFDTAYELSQMIIDYRAKKRLKAFCAGEFFLSRGVKPAVSEDKARQGDKKHLRLWQEFGSNLGIALANLINLIEPEIVLIGGGLSHAWPLFIKETRKTVKALVLSPLAKEKTRILKAKEAKWSGALGAAYLAQEVEI